jgi:serine/threonine-protein kinase
VFTNTSLTFVTVFWSIAMAIKYSKLWSAGYDWHDVFRQPRHRAFVDVVHDFGDEIAALFSKKKRAELRARQAANPPIPPLGAPGSPTALGPGAPNGAYGSHAALVRDAEHDRAEILRGVNALPSSDRALVDGVIPAADGLLRRIQSLAISLVEMERVRTPGAAERIEGEIAALEAQANPLDTAASEQRVRRLALLKRERRALADTERRSTETTGKLESCALALRNMRLDVLRLRAGGVASATQHITLLTERARSLADDVDAAVRGAAEGWRATAPSRRV